MRVIVVVLLMASVAAGQLDRPPGRRFGLSEPPGVELPALEEKPVTSLERPGRDQAGIHRSLPAKTEGAWTEVGAGRVWRMAIRAAGAGAVRVFFEGFSVQGGKVWIHDGTEGGEVFGPYRGRGLFGDGEFWSDVVLGDRVVIEYEPDPVAPRAQSAPFRIPKISHIRRLGFLDPPAPALPGVRKVWLAKMSGGLDRHLAEQFRKERLFTVVPRAAEADAEWRDRTVAASGRVEVMLVAVGSGQVLWSGFVEGKESRRGAARRITQDLKKRLKLG